MPQNKNYNFIWVDSNIDTNENVLYIKCLQNLGFKGFKTIKRTATFKMFLDVCSMEEDLIIFTNGNESEEVIDIIV